MKMSETPRFFNSVIICIKNFAHYVYKAQRLMISFKLEVHALRQINSFVGDLPLHLDIDLQNIQIENRIKRDEPARLSSTDIIQHGIGHGQDQGGKIFRP